MKREYYLANREEILRQRREYYVANRDKILRKRREYRQEHPGNIHAADARYREQNRAKLADKTRRWKEQNPHHAADWYSKNQERLRRNAGSRRASDPALHKHIKLKSLYGISGADYDSISASQDHRCRICFKRSTTPLCVDHCHKTKKVRGLLCKKCNFAIGLLDDNTENLKRALKYLNETRGRKRNGNRHELPPQRKWK